VKAKRTSREPRPASRGPDLADSGRDLADSGHDLTDSGRDLADSGRDLADSGHDLADSGHDLADSDRAPWMVGEKKVSPVDFFASAFPASGHPRLGMSRRQGSMTPAKRILRR
jgi:hypothetical protein